MADGESGMAISYICKTCGKQFKSPSGLSSHERSHSGDAPYKCCGKLFYSKANLTRHRCHKHKDKMRFVCTCGSAFAIEADLRVHQKLHEPGEYICGTCNKSIRRKKQYEDHMAMHRGEKNYVCSCGKKFTHQPNLTQHSRRCNQKS